MHFASCRREITEFSSDVNSDWTCQGQGQGPNLQGPGQGQGLDLIGQGLRSLEFSLYSLQAQRCTGSPKPETHLLRSDSIEDVLIGNHAPKRQNFAYSCVQYCRLSLNSYKLFAVLHSRSQAPGPVCSAHDQSSTWL